MSRAIKRWLSMLLLAAFAFSQASVAFAACTIGRGDLAQMFSGQSHACCDEEAAAAMQTPANVCLSHSTSDLQLLGIPASSDRAPVPVLVWLVPAQTADRAVALRAAAPPPNAVPPRILLHSFLI